MGFGGEFSEGIGSRNEFRAIVHAIAVGILGQPPGMGWSFGHLRIEHAMFLFPNLLIDIGVRHGMRSQRREKEKGSRQQNSIESAPLNRAHRDDGGRHAEINHVGFQYDQTVNPKMPR